MHVLSIIFSLIVLGASCAIGQPGQIRIRANENEVPVDVVNSFKSDFKKASTCTWVIVTASVVGEEYSVEGFLSNDIESPTYYEVSFTDGNEKEAAVYDHGGKLVQSKKKVSKNALPEKVRHTITSDFPSYALVDEQEAVIGRKHAISHYRLHLQSGNVTKLVVMDGSGKVLKEK